MFGAVRSPGAGSVWHGSFTEDGCYFLGPSWSLRGRGQHRWRGRGEEGKKRREQWPGERQKENKRTHLGGMQREDEKKEGEIGKGEW